MSRHQVWAIAAGMVLATLPASSQSPALRVVSASPTGGLGQLADADEVRIVFSEPMIELGTAPSGAAPKWIHVTPAAPAAFYWSGTKTLMFSPDASTPLPFATRFTVRIDGAATSVTGRALGAPYEFTFTTPTVRLLGAAWYRKDGRFDSPAVLQLRFNQPVRPADAAVHARVALTPHEWMAPALSAGAREWLQRTDAGGLERFDRKVTEVRRITSSSDAVGVRIAGAWDEKRFPPAPERVVFETTSVPPPDGWLTVTIDAAMPSPAGPATHAAQSTVVRLDSAFFVTRMGCATHCDPLGYNRMALTRQVALGALRQSLAIADVTDAAADRALAAARELDPDTAKRLTANARTLDLGFDAQPPARTWRFRVDSDLQADDGQTLGYPWVEIVENLHAQPFVGQSGSVWESAGGSEIPINGRNVLSATVWVAGLETGAVMPTLRQLQQVGPRQGVLLPNVAGEARRFSVAPDLTEAHGIDVRRLLSPQGTGLVWIGTAPGDVLPGSVPFPPNANSTGSGLVQVTNLGISVKDSPQSTLVFVTRLDTGAPVPDARVALVDAANTARWRGVTDRDGVALAPAMAVRQPNRAYDLSFIVTAEKDGDVAYVASNWNGVQPWSWGLNYQPFEPAAMLRGRVFTDRGVYKDGDDAHVKVVLRDDSAAGIRMAASGTDFDVRVNDSRGREVDRRTVKVNAWSSAEWSWHVPVGAALGYYDIQVARAGAFASNARGPRVAGSFLVAAYRRPDFRVDATMDADPAVLGSTLHATVAAKYLFGGALGARPVRWWARRAIVQAPPDPVRERYPDERYAMGYTPRYDEPRPPESPLPQKTGMLAADGRVEIALPTAAEGDLAYAYSIEGDVEDVSGQHIANRASLTVHPASLYVAVSRPPMFVDTKTGFTAGINAVDLTGRSVADVPVTVALFRQQWVPRSLSPGSVTFGSAWVIKEIPAGEWTVRSSATESPVPIPLHEGGCYILHATARDAAGRRTRTDVTFYALGPGVSSWRTDGNRIDLTPERKTWKPGETARILIQSPWERATALVTVEREGISHHRTFTIASTQDTVEVPVTEADVPNVYVSVVLVKGRTSSEFTADGDIGRPAYRVGYTELTVDDGSKRLRVEVSADREEYRPRQPARVSVAVTARDGKPAAGEVTLWAVDYGLLSLTGYTTPDVVKAIYAPKALQVMTEDSRLALMLRRTTGDSQFDSSGLRSSTVMGLPQDRINITMDGISTGNNLLSGDGFLSMAMPRLDAVEEVSLATGQVLQLRSDFRPLVFWLGSVTTDANGRATTTVTMPDSLTTYRIMAVAGDARSEFGFGEHAVHVTKPLTLLPAFPRFLSTGDRASFGAVVTNSGKNAGTAVVTVQSLDLTTLQFGTTASRTFQLAPGASESVKFDGLARAAGRARVRMVVTLGADADAFEMPLVVTAPMRLETTAAYGDTVDTAVERLALPPGILPRAGGLDVELASTALVGLGEGARYLTEYPYECAEQKASRALALLLASDLGGAFKLSGIPPEQYRAQGVAALRALDGYQCGNGGFALWPGTCGSESPYLTGYVLHVMKVADGLHVPPDRNVVDRALQYLQQHLSQPPPEVQWWPVWGASQAYAVKTLAEFGRSPGTDVTRLTGMAERLPVFALSYLADALAAMSDRGPRYQDVVRRLTNALRVEADRAHVEEVDDAALAWLWNTNVRATAVVLDGFSRRRDDAPLVAPLVRWLVASRTNGRWATTHENAMALEALVSYYRAFETDVPAMTATVKVGSATVGSAVFNGRSTTAQQVRLSMADLLRQIGAGAAPALTISRAGTGRVFYAARVQYLASEPPEAVDRGLHVERRYERYMPEGSNPSVTAFNAGDVVRVTVTLTLRGEGRYLALTDPLPAAFEPLEGWFETTASDLARQATRVDGGGDWLSIWRRGTFDHVEKHDDRVLAFATRLGSGRHEFSYLVRATTAGTFGAAGARVEAMYAPELTGRGAASTVVVR